MALFIFFFVTFDTHLILHSQSERIYIYFYRVCKQWRRLNGDRASWRYIDLTGVALKPTCMKSVSKRYGSVNTRQLSLRAVSARYRGTETEKSRAKATAAKGYYPCQGEVNILILYCYQIQ